MGAFDVATEWLDTQPVVALDDSARGRRVRISRHGACVLGFQVRSGGRSTVPFNYRMHLVGDKWKIIDVFLNGYVSQVALRRADFSSTVAASGASGLVKKIDELVDRQMADAS